MITQYVNQAKNLMFKNSSDILLVGGVVSLVSGGLLAVKQTPKAIKILEENEETNNIDKIKTVAPLYIPSIILTGLGITQIICSRNITNNKIAAVATAYTVSDTAFKTYRDKVKKLVKPEKYEEIKNEVASDKLKQDPINNKEVIIQTSGNTLIYDNMSGRYFRGNMDNINRSINLLNKRMMSEMIIELNQFYSEIDIPPIKMGQNVGWNIDRDVIDIDVSSAIANNGEPCLVIDYDVIPI